MQLSVRPEDLADAAAALRRLHDTLAGQIQDFATTASRLAPAVGPQAADSVRSTNAAAVAGAQQVEDNLAAFAQGLTAAAAYYAAVDGQALGRFTVLRGPR